MRGRVAAALCCALVSACSGTPASTTAAGSVAPGTPIAVVRSPAVSPSPPPSASPSASVTAAGLGGCPPAVAFARLAPLARVGGDADDLSVAAGGHIWVTAVKAGLVLELDAAGRPLRTIADPRGPEGIVQLPDGAFALAEQRANRVVRLDPATGDVTTIVEVPNTTTNDGVDGIAFDAARSRLLVPDSANGRLLAVVLTADGRASGAATVLATGLGRPVAAWPEADGSVDVGLETSPGLVRVGTSARATPLVAAGVLPEVDEVLGQSGLLYVTDLNRHLVAAVDPRTGSMHELVTGVSDPQGLALLPDGRLLLADTPTRTLAVVAPCGWP